MHRDTRNDGDAIRFQATTRWQKIRPQVVPRIIRVQFDSESVSTLKRNLLLLLLRSLVTATLLAKRGCVVVGYGASGGGVAGFVMLVLDGYFGSCDRVSSCFSLVNGLYRVMLN